MPLFEIDAQRELIPFRLLRGGSDIYEQEIEELLWDNLEEFTGEALFPVARQPSISVGGRPDIVAIDESGNVVVIEVKRDVDRGQLAQCLEYAGWARTTSLDELAGHYASGADAFFADWQEFTESPAPVVLSRKPRLVLIARDFHGRTESAFQFLLENGLPVRLMRVSIYEDLNGRKFVDVEGDHEPEFPAPTDGATLRSHPMFDGRRVRLTDLLDAGLLLTGDALKWERPRLGKTFTATVTENGQIKLPDGRAFPSPSRAASAAAEVAAYDGWFAWTVDRLNGALLNELRLKLVTGNQAHGDVQ